MAIAVTGSNPTAVTVASNTYTQDTTFNGTTTDDSEYVIGDSIAATVNAGVLVYNFGLNLRTTAALGGITMVNNGIVTSDQDTALELSGNGGAVTYSGTGSVIGHYEDALYIENVGAGSVSATIGNNITANSGEAVDISAASGAVNFTQLAGTTVSNSSPSYNAVIIDTASGNIVANLNGTTVGGGGAYLSSTSGNILANVSGSVNGVDGEGLDIQTAGAITVNSSGTLSSATSHGVVAAGQGAGLVRVNVTAGQIHADDRGIYAHTAGTGGVLVNMTGGQVGTAAQRTDYGIWGVVLGTAGDLTITATSVFANNTAIIANMDVAATGDVAVTANGTTDGSNYGIAVGNLGTGTTTVTVNGSVTGDIGIRDSGGATTVNNNGSITGTAGMAVDLGTGNDIYSGAGGLLTGFVFGGAGDDTLTSGAGNNTLNGGADHDILNGGAGADTMIGAVGNDMFFVDSAGDRIVELAAEGADSMRSSVSYTLAAGVSVETMQTLGVATTTAINLTGNELAQTLHGNAAANTLNGGGGADSLQGKAGDDTYFIDNTGDAIVETANNGSDRAIVTTGMSYTLGAGVSVETLRTSGSTSTYAVNLHGNNLVNTVQGNNGANVLSGGLGNDTMSGFGGSDIFRFNAALGVTNIDRITDFNAAADTIQIDNAYFTGLANGTLAAGAFRVGSAAADASDRIIYNAATGALIFDSNGNATGGATQFATLATGLSLTNADFVVI